MVNFPFVDEQWIPHALIHSRSREVADRVGFAAAVQQLYRAADWAWHGRVVWVASSTVAHTAAMLSTLMIHRRYQGARDHLRAADLDGRLEAAAQSLGNILPTGHRIPGRWDSLRWLLGHTGDAIEQWIEANIGPQEQAISDARLTWVPQRRDFPKGSTLASVVRDVLNDDLAYAAVAQTVHGACARSLDSVMCAGDMPWAVAHLLSGGDRAYESAYKHRLLLCFLHIYPELCEQMLDVHTLACARAFEAASTCAGWWWPHRDFVIVCERPGAPGSGARASDAAQPWASTTG